MSRTISTAAKKLLAEKKLEAAYLKVAETRSRVLSRSGGTNRSELNVWAAIAEGFRAAEQLAREAKDNALADRAAADAQEAIKAVLVIDEKETTPRLDLAAAMELAASSAARRRVRESAEDAIHLYEKAIALRTQVRIDDPEELAMRMLHRIRLRGDLQASE